MKTGGLIFAHNSKEIDYALMAIISAGLAKKQLEIPFTLVTDQSTKNWMEVSKIFDLANSIFEKIIITDHIDYFKNERFLFDGAEGKNIPFINSSRSLAYDLTPYDRTLLIDSDYLIFSKSLKYFLESNSCFMIPDSIQPLGSSETKMLDRYVSPAGITLYWATCIIFDKTDENKTLFDLVKHIRDNYSDYSHLYEFDNVTQFRNDIAFSISKHIIDGFNSLSNDENLPRLLTSIDNDILIDVDQHSLKFLIHNDIGDNRYTLCSISNTDIHIMNKQSIIRNKDKFLEII
jgi:hypothetical protein